MKRFYFFFIATLMLCSCQDLKTHGKYVSEQKDVWIDGYVNGLVSERKDEADRGLLYCRANPKNDGSAEPVCYKAKFQ